MAIMGRKKRAVAAGWNAVNKQRDEECITYQKKVQSKSIISETLDSQW